MSANELTLLRIRSLISDKEMMTAQANHDLARFGEWRTDYTAWHNQADAEIQKLMVQSEAGHPIPIPFRNTRAGDVTCSACGGDGIETCGNPDHAFLDAVGGHHPRHKMRGLCPECDGTGITPNAFKEPTAAEVSAPDSSAPPT